MLQLKITRRESLTMATLLLIASLILLLILIIS